MSKAETHNDPSMKWLIFFFVCFGLSVFAIGVIALFTYKCNAPEAPASGGHGMILPNQAVPLSQRSLTA